ncbi:MAG: hypothetical protein B7Z80_13475 [Rhodospirillales bacterium 20-64-7]|nr:MAG: hypothetical protein B7Z80_13475 [Rhodospirillales bacterium 20-64-7]
MLNRQGRPGGLTRKQIEDALKSKIHVIIPDLPKQMNESASFGNPAVVERGAFRQGITDLAREVGFTSARDDQGAAPPEDVMPIW